MAKKNTTSRRANAESMAAGQREISVSEFFAKNRHLLGFDNPRKALLTTVKEAVDNALDACEEAGILPDITVRIDELVAPASATKSGTYRITILDNGPGIVRRQVENIFGKLLYGSKFHKLKMSRGQQGIGISAAGMYGLMTTGKPMVIHTKPHKKKPAHHIELAMDTTKNKPEVTLDIETEEFPQTSSGTGTQVAIELEAKYVRGKTSVDAYLEQTAIANPHAKITYIPPAKASEDPALDQIALDEDCSEDAEIISIVHETTELADRIIFPRTVDELPPETQEIKPHPYGVELGTFLRMLKQSDQRQLGGFFKHEFCRVTPAVVQQIAKAATSKHKTITSQTAISSLDHAAIEKIYKALQSAKLRSPPTDCLSPIGVRQLLAGLLKGVKAEFYAASTRNPAVYRGNPFQIEAAVAFGGDIPSESQVSIIRFANRVPLLYQQSACCAFKSVAESSWKNYGLSQPRGALPQGPLIIMIHMASVWVPFTSESKEAIADYDEIRKEMRLALQECGRKLGTYLRRRQRMKRESQRRDVFERYIGEISKACNSLVGVDTQELYDALLKQAKRRTEIADAQLDDEGNFIKDKTNGRLDGDDGVLIIDRDNPSPPSPPSPPPPPSLTSSPQSAPAKIARSNPEARKSAKAKPAVTRTKASAAATKKKTQAESPKNRPDQPRKRSSIANKGKPKPRLRLGSNQGEGLFG